MCNKESEPLKIVAGADLQFPQDGTIEYNGKWIYVTKDGKRRKKVLLTIWVKFTAVFVACIIGRKIK